MKKIIFILVLFLSCFIIFNITISKDIYYVNIGDFLARGNISKDEVGYGYGNYLKDYLDNNHRLEYYNDKYIDSDYRIVDVIKLLEDRGSNDNLATEVHKADIITISLGMNELYYKLFINEEGSYTYINEMINDMDKLLSLIHKYSSTKVFVLGYYNIYNYKDDLVNYANYKLKNIVNKYDYIYVDTSNILENKCKYLENSGDYYLNNEGYYKIFNFIVEKL